MAMRMTARPSPDDRIRAALWFAERGFGVFSVWSTDPDGTCRCSKKAACTSPGKHPIPPKGFDDSTTDPERIRTMLSAASEPNYGLLPPPDIFVLDVDGEDITRLATLEQRYGPLPPTLRTRTANGLHYFLRWPEGRPRPLHKMFGLVTRWGSGAQAGYVVGPRSIHASGAEYAPVDAMFEIAELPERWTEAALAGESGRIRVGGRAAELPAVGHRHDWLRDRARYHWGLHGDRAVVRAILLEENSRLPQPKTAEEVERAIGEVEKFTPDLEEAVEERAARGVGDDPDPDLLGLPQGFEFPDDPDPVAFTGELGRMLEDIEAGTDASRVGLLGALIAVYGAMIPGRAYFHRDQTSSPFIALVGESAIGRKGTAMYRVLDVAGRTHNVVTVNRILLDGIASGEALVSTLVARHERDLNEPTVGLIFEEEYATLLAARGREGSTLDPRMRQAFDGGPLSHRKVSGTIVLNPPYWTPAIVGITPKELRERIEGGTLQTGSGNRWLYLPVRRRDLEPTNQPPEFRYELHIKLEEARRDALSRRTALGVEQAVTRALAEYNSFLAEHTTGIAYDLTKRYSVIAFRVALVHALVDGDKTVAADHLERAIALTEYARRGIPWVFGDTVGDPLAALLFRELVAAGRLTRTQITRFVIRDPQKRQAAIDELLRINRAVLVQVQTRGRVRHELRPAELLYSKDGPFLQVHALRTPSTSSEAERMERSAQGDGKKVEKSWKEDGKKTASETVFCHFYRDHQSHHRQVAGRWICDICAPESPAA